MICAWIMNSVVPRIGNEIMYCKMAKEMSDSLEDSYSHEKNSRCIFQTQYKMMNLKQGNKPLSQYYSQLKALIEKYNAYWPTYTCETQKAHRRETGVLLFLSRANLSYAASFDQLITGSTLPTLEEAYSKLSVQVSSPVSMMPSTQIGMATTLLLVCLANKDWSEVDLENHKFSRTSNSLQNHAHGLYFSP